MLMLVASMARWVKWVPRLHHQVTMHNVSSHVKMSRVPQLVSLYLLEPFVHHQTYPLLSSHPQTHFHQTPTTHGSQNGRPPRANHSLRAQLPANHQRHIKEAIAPRTERAEREPRSRALSPRLRPRIRKSQQLPNRIPLSPKLTTHF